MRLTLPHFLPQRTVTVPLCAATLRALEQILWRNDTEQQATELVELLKIDPACACWLVAELLPHDELAELSLNGLAQLSIQHLANLFVPQLPSALPSHLPPMTSESAPTAAAAEQNENPISESSAELARLAAHSAVKANLIHQLAVKHQCANPAEFELAALVYCAWPLMTVATTTADLSATDQPVGRESLPVSLADWLTTICGLPDVRAFETVTNAIQDAAFCSPQATSRSSDIDLPKTLTEENESKPTSSIEKALPKNAAQPSVTPATDEMLQNCAGLAKQVLAHWQQVDPTACADLAKLAHRLAPLEALQHEFATRLETEKLLAMKELAYGAGHEINNPLANISVRAQTLIKQEKDPERKRMLAAINGQVYRAHEMIADLMLFAQPPAIAPARMDLREVVERCVTELQVEAARQDSTLSFQTPASPVWAEVDSVQLTLALHAMTMNSLEALGRGGSIQLATSARIVGAGRHLAEILVRDDGPGIPPTVRRHLFDPFFSGREAGRGLGFGLSKCWRIITAHGGRIEVQDNSGPGVCFRILLPIGKAERKSSQPEKLVSS